MSEIMLKGEKKLQADIFLKKIINRINHKYAKKNLLSFRQVVMFSYDHLGLVINLNGRYERQILELLEKLFGLKNEFVKEKVALDIGANIGNHTLLLSEYFEKVYAFEPNPVTYEVLCINSKYSSLCNNIIPLNFGLSDSHGSLPFAINPHNIGASKIVEAEHYSNPNHKEICVGVKKLDDVEDIFNQNIGFIKLDVEGHEQAVLQGATKVIEKNKPLICFEQSPHEIVNGTCAVKDIIEKFGYDFYSIDSIYGDNGSAVGKFFKYIKVSIFGDQLFLRKVDVLEKRIHELILAVPKVE